jgi:AAA domain
LNPLTSPRADKWSEQFGPGGDAADQLPEWLKFENIEDLTDLEPTRVIEGLLRIGEKLGITSGSKSFKTWLLLYIGYCIANGLDCFGFKTNKSKVIVFDLELSAYGLKRRLLRIQKTLGQGTFENIKACSLRGKASKFCREFPRAQQMIVAGGFKVVIIDPVYKFLLGKEENSNGVVADMLDRMTVFCMEAQVAMIYVHHHSKGNQAEKDPLDRGSGAGAWSRDPDTLIDLTPHEDFTNEDKLYTCSVTVRDFAPIENFVVRWNFPLLVRDDSGLDPARLKRPDKGGRPQSDAEEKIIVALRTAECVAGLSGLKVVEITKATGVCRRTIQYRLRQMTPRRVVKCVPTKGYQLSVDERNKVQDEETLDDDV